MANIKPLTLQILIIISHYWYNVGTNSVQYTIGALLSNDSMIQIFKKAVELESKKHNNIVFQPQAEIMASRALKAAEQVCALVKATKRRMFALVVSHPPGLTDTPPLSASFTCAFYNVPVVGISARQSAFSDKYSHSSFLRTVPPYSEEARVWTDLIREFRWREISLVHSDDQEGKTLLSRLERASDDHKHFRITRTAPFSAEEGAEAPANFSELLHPIKQDQTRAIVLYARPHFARRILDAAAYLKMLSKEWAWIVTEQVLTMSNLPQGLIGLKLSHSAEKDHITDAVAVATQGIAKVYASSEQRMSKVNAPKDCSQNPYEVSTKLNKFETVSWLEIGREIYQAMKSVRLEGKTGNLRLDEKGDRILPVYDIVNVQYSNGISGPTRLVKVGMYGIQRKRPDNWDPKEPFLELLQLDMGQIVWPGNQKVTQKKEVCMPLSSKILDSFSDSQRADINKLMITNRNPVNGRNTGNTGGVIDKSPSISKSTGNTGDDCTKITIDVPAAPKSFMKKTFLKVVTKRSIPFVQTREIDGLGDSVKCDMSGDPRILKKEVPCSHTDPVTGKVRYYCCQGYCIDLLRRLANRTGIEENFTPFTYELHLVGDGDVGQERIENDTKRWTGMVGELLAGQADLAVAPMTITPERAARVEFTKPFKYLGLTILVKREESVSNLGSFLQPFENTLWVLVALSVHVVALVLYLLDRFSPFGRFKLAKSSSTEEDALNLSSAMWFAWGVLLNSGIGEGTPRSFSARVLGMVWAGFAMIIVASYTANLAAFLVLDRPEASISGIDDARLRNPQKEFKFATVRGSPVEQYFKRQVEYATMYRMMDMHNKDSADEAIELVKKGELKAFIWDSARISYEASRNCKLITAGEVFGRNGYGLAMKKDNPWLYEMSQAVLNFHERGFMERLDTQWILVKAEGCDRTESSPATLGLTNMAGVFIMVAAGIVAGVFLIFIEIAYKKRRGLKEKELELAKNAVDRWRSNIEKRKILRKTLSNSESDFHRYFNSVSKGPVGGGIGRSGLEEGECDAGNELLAVNSSGGHNNVMILSGSGAGNYLGESSLPGASTSNKETRIFFDNEIQV